MESQLKPGWQSSEFWLHLVQQVIAAGVLFGVIAPQNAEGLQNEAAKDIAATFVLVCSAASVVHYVHGRHGLKSLLASLGQKEDDAPPPPPKSGLGVIGCFLAALAAGLLAGPVSAQPTPAADVKVLGRCPCGPLCACPDCQCGSGVRLVPVAVAAAPARPATCSCCRCGPGCQCGASCQCWPNCECCPACQPVPTFRVVIEVNAWDRVRQRPPPVYYARPAGPVFRYRGRR